MVEFTAYDIRRILQMRDEIERERWAKENAKAKVARRFGVARIRNKNFGRSPRKGTTVAA